MGNLEFSSPDFDWDDYGRQIYVAIWRAWHRRLLFSTEEFNRWGLKNGMYLNHQNRVVFTIERNGQVTGVAVETPAGCMPLDQSGGGCPQRGGVAPATRCLPPGQRDRSGSLLDEGGIRGMRRGLQRLKNAGYF